ncbi:MAG: hypothetical protein Q9171_005926 [Xanthocarpia ochracea]
MPSHPHPASSRQVHSLQGPTEEFSFHQAYHTANQSYPSSISPDPPVLPPIPRVASQHDTSKDPDVEARFMRQADDTEERSQMKLGSQEYQSSKLEEPRSIQIIDDERRPPCSKSAGTGLPLVPLQQNSRSQIRQLRLSQANPKTLRSHSEPFSQHTEIRSLEQTNEGVQPARAPPPPPLRLSSGPVVNGAQARQSRTKLNLLNPMALLAKRRSHQGPADSHTERVQYRITYPTVPGIPDDYDPRIRGKVVHDFSAPRPGTNDSSNRARGSDKQRDAIMFNSRKPSPDASTTFVEDDSPNSSEREHTPQFKEHFDEDFEPLRNGPAKQRTSAFMYQVSLSESQPDPDPSVLPPFARHLPSNITTATNGIQKNSSPPPKLPEIASQTTSVAATIPMEKSLPSIPPSSPPAKARSRASSSTDSSYQPAGLPKHFKSNASRFSFDLTGVGSAAQEKLLEDKHRQHERNRARGSHNYQLSETGISARDAVDDDDDDEYANQYDDVEDDGSVEERIPGVNADEDESGAMVAYQHTQNPVFVVPCKSSLTSGPSLASTGITSPNTPRDSMGIPINPSTTRISPGLVYSQSSNKLQPHSNTFLESSTIGLGYPSHAHPANESDSRVDPSASRSQQNHEDDLYFDDGMIEGLDMPEYHVFDESVFDDDNSNIYGVPLRDRKPVPKRKNPPRDNRKSDDDSGDPLPDPKASMGNLPLSNKSFSAQENSFAQLDRGNRGSFEPSADVSNDAGYLDALTVGVNQAALNGKFNRWPTLRSGAESGFNDSTGSFGVYKYGEDGDDAGAEGLLISGGIEDADDFAIDDALTDDSIIAAANAEALENDDEGFYGQEFGFFARASGADEAEYANGGYFGSRGFEGIGRSHSGRNKEPSLTPITERSEWSNRNSAISLAMQGFQPPHSAGPQCGAGLAQLADLMHLDDDDLSLSALMKLRRGAWGGSNASLQSSSSGSPLTYAPGVGFSAAVQLQHSNSSNGNVNLHNGSPLTMYTGHIPASSSYSLVSSNGYASSPEDSQPSPTSATVTSSGLQQAPQIQQPPQSAPAFMAQQQYFVQQSISTLSPPGATLSHQAHRRSMSPVKRNTMGPPPRPPKGHSRNSSNASESVSYVQESGIEDGGQGRWVLEKRRTDESGVVEVLGREIVEGGRI